MNSYYGRSMSQRAAVFSRLWHLEFNGSNSDINCGSGVTLDDMQDDELTIGAWLRRDSTGSIHMVATKCGNNGASPGWYLDVDASDRLYMKIYCATTDAISAMANNSFPNDTDWHYAAAYWDDAGSPRAIYLSLDGEWEDAYALQQAGVGAIVSDAAQELHIGSVQNVNLVWDGGIGWMYVSADDRHGHGADFLPPPRCTLPAVDPVNAKLLIVHEGRGATTQDLSGNDNDGTIANCTWSYAC